jgi:GWxTD domain-containing protein
LALAAGFAPPAAADLPSAVQSVERPAFRAHVLENVDGDSTGVVIQVEAPYDALCFLRAPGGWEARFAVIAQARRRDRVVAGELWAETLRVARRAELRQRGARFREEYPLRLPPGEYALEVTLSEPGCGHEGRVRLGAWVGAELQAAARLSPILLGPCGLSGRVRDLMTDPRVGIDLDAAADTVCAYAELSHRGLPGDTVRVSWRLLREADGAVLAQGERVGAAGAGRTALTWSVPLTGAGIATCRLEVAARIGEARAAGTASFGVRRESDQALAPFFRDELDALGYIADEGELTELRMAAPEERGARWDEFWARRDPSPGTEENEFKDEFFRRLRYADAAFRTRRPGWRTDRGRIYIRHGEPDAIERDPVPEQGVPVEVWHYDRLGRRFVFADAGGFGEFRLVSAED